MKKLIILYLLLFSSNIFAAVIMGPFATSSNISTNLPANVVTNNYTYSDVTINNSLYLDDLAVSTNADADTFLGRVALGLAASGSSDVAYFSHYDHFTNTNYAFRQGASGAVDINSPTSQAIYFRNNNVIHSVFNSSGNLGIGNASPTAKLEVSGNIVSSPFNTNGSISIDTSGSTTNIYLDSNSDSYIIGGSLGIGTTSPQRELSVVGDAQVTGNLYVSSGSLGVGTTSPQRDLSVVGDLQVTGNIYVVGDSHLDGAIFNKATDTATDYNPSALTNDYIITFTDLSAQRNCILSTEDVQSGATNNVRVFVIKDKTGNAATNNIVISLESGGTIDGAASYTISAAYNSVTIMLDGTNGYIY